MALFNQKTAATLTEQLGGVLAEINKLRVDIAALSETASTDQDHHRLNVWRSRLDSALAKETKLRGEIADAVAAERLVEQDKAFDVAVTISRQEEDAGDELRKAVARVWPAALRLIELDDAFRAALPMAPPDWDALAFTRNLIGLIINQLYIESDGRLRGTPGLVQSPYQLSQNPQFSLAGALREHLAVGLKGRPNPQRDGLIAAQEQSGGEPAGQGE